MHHTMWDFTVFKLLYTISHRVNLECELCESRDSAELPADSTQWSVHTQVSHQLILRTT